MTMIAQSMKEEMETYSCKPLHYTQSDIRLFGGNSDVKRV